MQDAVGVYEKMIEQCLGFRCQPSSWPRSGQFDQKKKF
ncbi:hypothetical protein D1BOALGB6SA_3927 [Olavius sp. associated proteobacterium Delta 1]|nr:hypothetical protein D1BOALGB6SA_3927 [Olavius sp. associated proteobacterium Delta 1]